jgi:hypothetical protein
MTTGDLANQFQAALGSDVEGDPLLRVNPNPRWSPC